MSALLSNLSLIECLSDEALLIIFKFVCENSSAAVTRDLIRLSHTCTRFRQLTEDKELCRRFIFSWELGEGGGGVSTLSFVNFFKNTPRAALVTSLDVSDAYWIPSELLKDVAVQMVNLKELRTAGVDLWYSDMISILKETPKLQKLSWSWDDRLEDATKKVDPNAPFSPEFPVLEELVSTSACQSLQSLLIHVPMPKTMEKVSAREMDQAVPTYSSMAYLISRCTNLEELWLLCWPRTREERVTRPYWPPQSTFRRDFSTHQIFEGIPDDRFVKLDKLKRMVVFGGANNGYARFTCPRLIKQLRLSLIENGLDCEMLWIDHSSFDVNILKTDMYGTHKEAIESATSIHTQLVPLDKINNCSRISFSFWPYLEWSVREVPIPRTCTHLLVSKTDLRDGLINVLADGESNLKSFCAQNCPSSMMDLNLFVTLHNNLEEICIPSFIQGMGEYCIYFSKLKKLKRICLPVDCLLKIQDKEAVEAYRNALSSAVDSDPDHSDNLSPCGLDLLVAGCPLIEEVEIGFDNLLPRIPTDVNEDLYADSISGIVGWKHLKKLTLVRIPILNAQDLINICTNCTGLESLRLTKIGTPGGPFFKHLICQSLPHCKNLKDLRLEQDMIGSPGEIMKALSSCKKLRRCLIWSSHNYQPLKKAPVLQLFKDCPDLVVLYTAIEPTTETSCFQIAKAVESEFRKKRKSLSVIIRGGFNGDLVRYPSVHYRQLVENEPQVCQITDFSNF